MMIKSCPCCGSNNVKFTVRKASDKEYGYVSCDDCKLTQGETSIREKSEAIKLWNTRPSWDKLKEEVEKKKMYYKNGSPVLITLAATVFGTEYYGNVLKMMNELDKPIQEQQQRLDNEIAAKDCRTCQNMSCRVEQNDKPVEDCIGYIHHEEA